MLEVSPTGFIGRIPVRNLWLLMLYASDLFAEVGTRAAGIEENPDEIPDLIAEVLVTEVNRRLRRNLTYGYRSRSAELNRVRGRIDLLQTHRKQLLDRGKVACTFDELTVDTTRNRYVRAALEVISKIVRRPTLAHQCRCAAEVLAQSGVSSYRPTRTEISQERFGRQDNIDRAMVGAAKLAFDLALPMEDPGNRHLPVPAREMGWVRKLFERGIAGFYRTTLTGYGWTVGAGVPIHWPVARQTAGISAILPSMRTDIVLQHVGQGVRWVIDTKFTTIVTQGWYRESTLRSGYLYQIYAYLRSQEGQVNPLDDMARGMLLHPSVDDTVDETVLIQGHEIRFATVDLAARSTSIRKRLLEIVRHSGFDRLPPPDGET